MERFRFMISDGAAFEYMGEAAFPSFTDANAHATQVAKELAEDDTWHGGLISVRDLNGNEITQVPIGVGRSLTTSEALRRCTPRAAAKSTATILRLDEALARRSGRAPHRDD